MFRLFAIIAGAITLAACSAKPSNPVDAFSYRELSFAEAAKIVPDLDGSSESEYREFPFAEINGRVQFPSLSKSTAFSIRAKGFCIRGIFFNWGEHVIDLTPYNGKNVKLYGSMEGGRDSLLRPDPSFEAMKMYPVQSKLASDIPDCDDVFAGFMALTIKPE